jgi:hypothetical protein
VARLLRELQHFPPKLNEQEFESLKSQHPDFMVFYIADKWPEKVKPLIMTLPAKDMTPVPLAQEFAALYHNRQVSTIQSDWKKHKPHSFRR